MSDDRMYCFMIGRGVAPDPNGDCPECGEYGRDHRRVPSDECWAFVGCGGECGEKGGCGKGHPCRLPPDHEGLHDCHEKRGERR